MKKALLYSLTLLCPTLLQAQTNTDILLLDMAVKKNQLVLSNPRNITNHTGYDNQPHFHKSQPFVYYSSANADGKMDIRQFDFNTKQTADVTTTPENEFSPTLTPDGQHISCIIQRENGQQDLGMYNLASKEVTVLIDNLTVGYHAWIDDKNMLLFILAEDGHELQHYNLDTKQNKILAKSIGRSLHKIPGQNAMSFIDKTDSQQWQIKRYDTMTGTITTLAPTLAQKEDITWTKNGMILSSDGEKIYSFIPGKSKTWQEVKVKGDTALLKGITRMASNQRNSQLAVVVSE
ncbi:TolB family protein [Pontibacter sp. H249]|uniref:TolB family protein n=1 Tax=Pontibacter sp. H249 TaxID=3133420 RepID=UPI0030C376F6